MSIKLELAASGALSMPGSAVASLRNNGCAVVQNNNTERQLQHRQPQATVSMQFVHMILSVHIPTKL
jgi:hypothetical protein